MIDVKITNDSFVRTFAIASLLTFSFTLCSLVAAIALVPRRSEGIRDVPDVEWPTYAFVVNTIPLFLSVITLSFVRRSQQHRVFAWIVAGIVSYLAHETFLTSLLHRDFTGNL